MLPIDLALKLFDETIMPILLFSSEIWGYEDSTLLERIHSDFLRKLTNLRRSTPLYMFYAEFGRYSIHINIKIRMINYWNKLIIGKQSKLSYKIYKYILQLPSFESKWIKVKRKLFNEIGLIKLVFKTRN